MAYDLKDTDYGVFDKHQDSGSKEKGSLLKGIAGIFSNRYLVMAFIFALFGVVILFRTGSLQFSDYQNTISEASKGVQRQYTTKAPRGDIYDSKGVLLASSEEFSVVSIANSYLDDDKLNSLCLELSHLFEDYNCSVLSDLDNYFIADPANKKYEYLKEVKDIKYWQSDKNLFNLKDYSEGVIVTFTDDYVKTDPEVFFLYLRNLFKINTSYTAEDAYRIIKIRYQIFKDNWMFQKGTPVNLATDCPDELIKIFREQNYKYMGIVVSTDYARTYSPMALYCCHVLGYVGPVTPESYSSLSTFGYSSDDMVGKGGVESQMERYLHGQSGVTTYSIWTKDGVEGAFFPSKYTTEAKKGATVKLTIDSKLQEVGTEALKSYIADAQAAELKKPEEERYKTASSGAFVMMDVNTGAVLALGSYPNYDPKDFILKAYKDPQAEEQVKYYLGVGQYKEITAEDAPMWNRATQSRYAPGSTFKPITALAALEQGKITPSRNTIRCESPIDIGGLTFRCLEFPDTGHGPLDLNSAMATSCNIYFMRLGVDTGIDYISEMALRFGLGKKTGIDLPGESSGVVASRETKRLLRSSEYNRTWFPADTAQSSIGQFDNNFTILQLCRYTAGIATNKLPKPHVIDTVTASDGSILYKGETESEDLGISESSINAVRNAMRKVITGAHYGEGTAQKQFKNFPLEVVCKTGTAETGKEKEKHEYSNGLFICYAPKDDPKVAIALVVEKGEWGASTVTIAKKLLAEYFNIDANTETKAATETAPAGDVGTVETTQETQDTRETQAQ